MTPGSKKAYCTVYHALLLLEVTGREGTRRLLQLDDQSRRQDDRRHRLRSCSRSELASGFRRSLRPIRWTVPQRWQTSSSREPQQRSTIAPLDASPLITNLPPKIDSTLKPSEEMLKAVVFRQPMIWIRRSRASPSTSGIRRHSPLIANPTRQGPRHTQSKRRYFVANPGVR